MTVLSKPTQLIAESVGDVFYPRIAENANKKLGITSSIIKATLILSALGVIPFSVIIIFGPGLFEFTFGNEWARAGEYARWIAVWSFFMFINRPVVRSLQVISEQLFHLKFTLIVTFVRIITLSLSLYFFENELASIAIYGIIGGISNLFLIFMTLIKTRRFDVKNLRA